MTSVINCRDITPLFEKEPVVLSKDGYVFLYALKQSLEHNSVVVYSNVTHYSEAIWYQDYVKRLHAI